MIDEVRALLDRHHIGGNHLFVEGTEEILPGGHLDAGVDLQGVDMVVYDTAHYAYSTILRLLEATPGNTLLIATYSTKTKVLMTDGRIFRSTTR
jgi:hypothetical protein